MGSIVHLSHNSKIIGTVTELPSSKSISNRALILRALEGNQSVVSNLSSARDTALMQQLVGSKERMIDVMDAGTTMRFLSAYFAITNQKKILTGTARMKERPIAILVEALQKLGAEITYVEKEGYPPIETLGFLGQKTDILEIPGNISSQYISALMMIGPTLPKGLTLKLTGKIGSVPYISMTANLMKQFGATVSLELENQLIRISSGAYSPANITVEADWSAASYWYSFVALAEEGSLHLPNVSERSLQGDRVIVELMDHLGVKSYFKNGNLELSKKPTANHIEWDFKDCPDLAQTVLPLCAAKFYTGKFTGLESLRIKETDRIAALQNELSKLGARLEEENPGTWILQPGKFKHEKITINTYHDHRMAMGFAPLSAIMDLTIEAPEVVNKSYPGFWRDVQRVGVKTEIKW